MVKFIVVEDNEEEVKHIENLLNSIEFPKEIYPFNKLDDKLRKEIADKDSRKVYILDIELEDNVSGINIAKLIRDTDYESEIIIITNHDSMFESAHRSVYEIFAFIEKFHNFDERFIKVINDVIKRNFDNKMFIYNANNSDFSIYYREILYIYTDGRKLVIVTTSNKYTINMTIKEMLTLLDSRFKQCHKSCIVNTQHVENKDYKNGIITLDNGCKVDFLSKKYMKELGK